MSERETQPPAVAGEESPGTALDLTPPEPVSAVSPEAAEQGVPVAPEVAHQIEALVTAFVGEVVSLDVHGEAYRRRAAEIDAIGEREIVATSQMSNRLLERPVQAVNGVLQGKAPVAKSLVELRHSVEELNPARYDLAHGRARKLLGVVPLGSRLRDYFDRYAQARQHIEGIVTALGEGRGELQRDNAAILQEQRGLWTEMETLRRYAFMARRLDETLDARIEAIASTDQARSRVLKEDILYPVRRRRQEILTQLAVAAQGYAALRVVEKNNLELMRAIQTATTTTVAAMRTAVMTAQALADQRMVVEQVKSVNEATSGMIESTSNLLRDQSSEVQTEAAGAGVDIGALQRAWDNVFAALDQIDAYKLNALEAMKVTVRELNGQVERSRGYVERLRQQEGGTGPVASARERESLLRLP